LPYALVVPLYLFRPINFDGYLMIAIPALDLQTTVSGHRTGTMGAPVRGAESAQFARSLADLGFCRLHLVDFDAASGAGSNVSAVEGIVRDTHVRVQVGEVSTITDIEHLIRAGVDQVIVGSRAIEEPEWLADVAELYPGAITVATDVRDRRVVRRGWVRTLPVDILDLVDELNQLSLGGLLVTMPQRDSPMPQSELALLEDAAEHAQYSVSVVGGGSSIQDLRALEHRGITGVVIDARKIFGGDIDARVIAQEFGA
jgi:phosphoribosylformimino-5-aminoimidazole carboxamide ribotide isomerase